MARLLERELVRWTASAADARVQVLELTPAGLDLHRKFRPAVNAMMDRIMAPLSDHERNLMQELLARVIAANQVKPK